MKGTAFFDGDPATGAMRTWACEDTLEELKVRVARALLHKNAFSQIADSRQVEGLVYDRLARLIVFRIRNPRIWILQIEVSEHCPLPPARLKALLDHCSSPLKRMVKSTKADDQVH